MDNKQYYWQCIVFDEIVETSKMYDSYDKCFNDMAKESIEHIKSFIKEKEEIEYTVDYTCNTIQICRDVYYCLKET